MSKKKVLTDFTLPAEGDIIDQIAGRQDAAQLKAQVDFPALLADWGLEVKKNGRGHMLRCPFHADKTPSCSIDPEQKLFHCFGCGQKGDVIDFVRLYKNTDFKGALELLKQQTGSNLLEAALPAGKARRQQQSAGPPASPPPAPPPTPPPQEQTPEAGQPLLSLDTVADYYHKRLYAERRAVDYLQERGITDSSLYTRFRIGCADGSLAGKASARQQEELKAAGLLRKNGQEHFAGCLTFPLTGETGRVVHFYGRSLNPAGKLPHLYLPGSHRSVFNRKASRVYDEIILTESVIDALSLLQLGLQNVQALYGTNGFTEEHLQILKADRVKLIILALDNDPPGREAAAKLAEVLTGAGMGVKQIFPEARDWNCDLTACQTEDDTRQLAARIQQQITAAELRPGVTAACDLQVKKTGQRYLFKVDGVTYRLLGVKQAFVASLRVNIKAEYGSSRLLDNADLYSARSRSNLSQQLSRLFEIPEQRIENDLLAIVDWLEAERDRELAAENNEPRKLSVEEKKLGMALLTSPDLFKRIADDLSLLGYVGEDLNKQLIYLAASSRKLADPISVLILSQSASGKSLLVETVRKLIPPQDVVAVSSLSDQALNYMSAGGLLHKFLILGEAVHSEVVEHQIREMLSNHELSRMVTCKNERTGQMETSIIKSEVIVAAMLSSTRADVNPENASRCFVINTDESREQTRVIHQAQKQKYSLARYSEKANDIPAVIRQHHAAQQLLTARTIINPLAEYLDFPDNLMRTRRDHERFIDLIAAVCFLRQYRKEEQQAADPVTGQPFGYIVCDLEDYEVAYRIISGILPATISNFPESAIRLYQALRELAGRIAATQRLKPEEVQLSQRQIREETAFSQMMVKRSLRLLVEYEYLRCHGALTRGSKRTYSLVADEDIHLLDVSMIPPPEQLAARLRLKKE